MKVKELEHCAMKCDFVSECKAIAYSSGKEKCELKTKLVLKKKDGHGTQYITASKNGWVWYQNAWPTSSLNSDVTSKLTTKEQCAAKCTTEVCTGVSFAKKSNTCWAHTSSAKYTNAALRKQSGTETGEYVRSKYTDTMDNGKQSKLTVTIHPAEKTPSLVVYIAVLDETDENAWQSNSIDIFKEKQTKVTTEIDISNGDFDKIRILVDKADVSSERERGVEDKTKSPVKYLEDDAGNFYALTSKTYDNTIPSERSTIKPDYSPDDGPDSYDDEDDDNYADEDDDSYADNDNYDSITERDTDNESGTITDDETTTASFTNSPNNPTPTPIGGCADSAACELVFSKVVWNITLGIAGTDHRREFSNVPSLKECQRKCLIDWPKESKLQNYKECVAVSWRQDSKTCLILSHVYEDLSNAESILVAKIIKG